MSPRHDSIHEHVAGQARKDQKLENYHQLDRLHDHAVFKSTYGWLAPSTSSAIVEVLIGLILLVAVVYAFRRFIGRRCKNMLGSPRRIVSALSKASASTASVCGGRVDDSIVDDLEAGTQLLFHHPGGGLEVDEVDTFRPFNGQDSFESHNEARCTLPQLIGSFQIPSRPSRLVSSGSNSSDSTRRKRNDGDMEAGGFAHVDAMLGAFRSLEASFRPVQRQVSHKRGAIEPIAEEKEGDGDDEENQKREEKEEEEDDEQQDEEEPVSIKYKLLDMFDKMEDSQTALLGTRLCRSCPLERSSENRDLTWDRELGAGTYGRVSLVFHDEGVFAIKELTEAAGESERFAAESEMETILSLGMHENVVKVYAMDDQISTRPILMEAAVGDLHTAIDTARFSFNEEAKLLHGAAKGLAHVHSCGKVHGDMKPSNIVLVPNSGNSNTIAFTAKIADFGFTVDVGQVTRIGTRGFGAPELLLGDKEAQTYMDVFAFGVVILQTFLHPEVAEDTIFTHSLILTDAEKTALDDIFEAYPDNPYAAQVLEDLIMERTLADGSFEDTMLTPDNLRPDVLHKDIVCDLLKRCLSPEPAIRPTMQQVVQDLAFLCRASA